MKIINPLEIKSEDLPLIVFSDDLRGFFAWGIRVHTEGLYSHAMLMVTPKEVVTQGGTYSEVPIEKYMSNRYRLKFWSIKNLTIYDKIRILDAVNEDLKQPWWRKRYDWLGVAIGQLFRVKWIQNPFTYYCSERVAKYLRLIPFLKDKIPAQPAPSKLNKLFKTLPELEVYGYWFAG